MIFFGRFFSQIVTGRSYRFILYVYNVTDFFYSPTDKLAGDTYSSTTIFLYNIFDYFDENRHD